MKFPQNRSTWWLWFLLLLLYPLDGVYAVQRSEDPSEAMVRDIAKDLRCAVCQNQSVYESNSDLAKDMLEIIREKVQAGEAEEAIRRYFFDRYGDYVYLEPTQDGKNWILWLTPFLGLLIGGVALWAALKRWRREPTVIEPQNQQPSETTKTRIQEELDRIQV